MPIQVNHDEQRRRVMAAAATLIAAGGEEAASVRAIAKAVGYSTTIVSHYFSDKRDLLLMTYRYAAERSLEINRESGSDDSSRVRSYCLSLLPRTAEMQAIWRTWFAFWNIALTDAEFAAEQRRYLLGARENLCATFDLDPPFRGRSLQWRQQTARELMTLVMGVALQVILDPSDWTEEQQIQIIDDRLDSLARSSELESVKAKPRRARLRRLRSRRRPT